MADWRDQYDQVSEWCLKHKRRPYNIARYPDAAKPFWVWRRKEGGQDRRQLAGFATAREARAFIEEQP